MLKTISLFTIFFLLFHVPLSAQSGKLLIGGKMGFSYSADDNNIVYPEETNKSITISFSGAPVFGYFFTKNFMAGIDFDFSIEKMTADYGSAESTKFRSVTLNPLVRFYFNSHFFAEARFIWGPSKSEINYADNLIGFEDIEYTARKLGFGAGIGYDIKLSEGLRLEPLIYYTRYSNEIKDLEIKIQKDQIMLNLGLIYIL